MKVKILIVVNYTIFNLLKNICDFLLFLKIVEIVIWNEIKVRQDANGNGKVDSNELLTLEQANITMAA